MIEDERADVRGKKPWWFSPALLGVFLGGFVGLLVLPTPLPPCAAPDVPSEVVTRRFLERLGSSADAIAECWSAGRLDPEELDNYVLAKPPASISFVTYAEGRGNNDEIYVQWNVALTWNGSPPRGWSADQSRWIMLVRHDNPTRWTIEQTHAPQVP